MKVLSGMCSALKIQMLLGKTCLYRIKAHSVLSLENFNATSTLFDLIFINPVVKIFHSSFLESENSLMEWI